MTQFETIKNQVDGKSFPILSNNADDEIVIVEPGKDECGNYFQLTTIQKNDWLRINRFYDDGTATETFEK